MLSLTEPERSQLVDAYHMARTALSALEHVPTRYARMIWATNNFASEHSYPPDAVYKALSRLLEHPIIEDGDA